MTLMAAALQCEMQTVLTCRRLVEVALVLIKLLVWVTQKCQGPNWKHLIPNAIWCKQLFKRLNVLYRDQVDSALVLFEQAVVVIGISSLGVDVSCCRCHFLVGTITDLPSLELKLVCVWAPRSLCRSAFNSRVCVENEPCWQLFSRVQAVAVSSTVSEDFLFIPMQWCGSAWCSQQRVCYM